MTVEERYKRDPVFKTVVDRLAAWIEGYEITPTEAREAAVLACTIVEMRRGAKGMTP